MNHLTNLYKHKCEQLQEQLNHLTRQLNEVTAPAAPAAPWPPAGSFDKFGDDAARLAARLAREAAEQAAKEAARVARERLFVYFRNLPPGGTNWQRAYDALSDADRIIFHQMFGMTNGGTFGFSVRYYLGQIVTVKIIVGPSGIPQIMYFNLASGSWVAFPNGVTIPGIGTNTNNGIRYTKDMIRGVGQEADQRFPDWFPNDEYTFTPFNPLPDTDIPPGQGGGRIDFGNGSGPGGGGNGSGGGGINPNNN